MLVPMSHQSYSDAILRPESPEARILFPAPQDQFERFLFRQRPSEKVGPNTDQITLQGQDHANPQQDALVRLPGLRLSPSRVIVLQRWIGRVESVRRDRFVAVTTDATNPGNPPEESEFDLAEVSEGDRALVARGAVFYWCIGYHDSVGGQRERTSSLRFVRSPQLSEATLDRILEQADRMATFLQESD